MVFREFLFVQQEQVRVALNYTDGLEDKVQVSDQITKALAGSEQDGTRENRQQTGRVLMLSTVLPTAILTVPAVIVKHARQDAWVSIMIATVAGLLVAWLVVSLSLRFPGKTLTRTSRNQKGICSSMPKE